MENVNNTETKKGSIMK